MRIYTTKELADWFNVSSVTIRREIERGNLKCFYVGNEARITEEQCKEYANIKENGKTDREVELEKIVSELRQKIKEKEDVIIGIKELLLRQV